MKSVVGVTAPVLICLGTAAMAASLVNEVDRGDRALKEGRFPDAVRAYDYALGPVDPGMREIMAGLFYKKGRAHRGAGEPLVALVAVKQAQRYSDEAAFDALREELEIAMATEGYIVSASEIRRSFNVASGEPGRSGEPVKLDLWVAFATDSATLTDEGRLQASEIAGALRSEELRQGHFLLLGHTDVRGAAAYNMDLSLRRARSLKDHLVSRHGLSKSLIGVDGKGESNPLVRGNSAAAHARNRRVEIWWFGQQSQGSPVR